eukprot:5299369-Amphidinium_carterae.1
MHLAHYGSELTSWQVLPSLLAAENLSTLCTPSLQRTSKRPKQSYEKCQPVCSQLRQSPAPTVASRNNVIPIDPSPTSL